MPALPHSVEGQPFDIEASETVKWIMAQPGIKDWLWAKARGTGRIKFDPVAKQWSGVTKRPKDYTEEV